MKKELYLTLCALATTLPVAAQQRNFQITGTLCDSITHEAQAFATIRLLDKTAKDGAAKGAKTAAEKVLRVATTEANGKFKLTVPKAGNYTLEAVVIGMQPLRRDVTLSTTQPTLKLDTLYIKEYSNQLGAATITAQRPLVKAEIDKISYSMADDPEAQTNTTLEMLRKVPMVTVDGEDNIKVNGSSSFKIYVNGKPNNMMTSNPSTILKSYPASVIKKIEVITNPGAKYDAEGVGGILNIITTSETKTTGYTFTPSLTASTGGVSGNLFGMAQYGKFMISAYYGAGQHKSLKPITGKNELEVYDDDVNHLFLTDSELKNRGVFQYGNLEASYEFSDKDLLSVSGGVHGWNGIDNSYTQNRMMAADGSQTYAYDQHVHSKSQYLGVNVSTDFQHTFKEDQYLTFSYRYDLSPTYNKQNVYFSNLEQVPENKELLDAKTDPDQRSIEHTAQVDFTTPIAKKHTLSAGLKYINRINRSNNEELNRKAGSDDEFVLNEERSLLYRHRGDIASAYAEYQLKLKNFSLMAGSRYEYYRVKVTYPDGKRPSFSTDMHDWVPQVSVGFNLKPTMMLKAGYNLRIARPDISYLSPYVEQTTPEFIIYGNPNLGSSKAHSLNLTYSTFSPKLNVNLNLGYTFSNNQVSDYSFHKDGVLHTTYGNFVHSKETSLSGYVNWTIFKGTSLFMNMNVTYSDYKSYKTNEHDSGFGSFIFGSIRQDLPWKLKLSLHGGGSTGGVSLQTKSKGFYFYGLSLSRSFLKEDRLRMTFSSGGFIKRYMKQRSETYTETFRQLSLTKSDRLYFSFGLSYRLGSLKAVVKKVERSIENSDVMQGGGGSQGASQGGQGGGQGGM